MNATFALVLAIALWALILWTFLPEGIGLVVVIVSFVGGGLLWFASIVLKPLLRRKRGPNGMI